MGKFKIFIILLVLFGVLSAGLYKWVTDQNIVILKDGTVKTVDNGWESGDFFYYENDEEIRFLNKDEVVDYRKKNIALYLEETKKQLAFYHSETTAKIQKILKSMNISIDPGLFSPLALMALVLFLLMILILKRFGGGKKEIDETKEQDQTPIAPIKESGPVRLDIVRFFLNLYRHQIGAAPDAPAEFIPLVKNLSDPNHIYELRVRHMEDWSTRRMTIGPLGDESGSKSQCFSVIFDVHYVVKVPARPINDFEEYIDSIKKEVHIVDKLAPKECIIPKVSVILGLIHTFPYSDNMSAERLEEKYIQWLRKYPEYQDFLKIQNTFIYIMDLSKYYFLGHIIDSLHDLKESITTQIVENSGLIWEPDKSKSRYNAEKDNIYFEIRKVYQRCDTEIRRFLARSGIISSIPLYQIQSWFLAHLTGKEIAPDRVDLPEKTIFDLNRMLREFMRNNAKAIEAYRGTIMDHLHKTTLVQNKSQMGSIISNLIDLLAWLHKKRVAMRDLKPDNLFVAGDPEKYPLFLKAANEFTLGIIDVETAVDFERTRDHVIEQPLLGGTPFYATPSHFFKNEQLINIYKSVRKVLHMQDWHATLVMIYKSATGDLLFDQTAKLFGQIKSKIQDAYNNNLPPESIYEDVSRIFWRSAVLEFQMKVAEKEKPLKYVNAAIPPMAIKMFKSVLKKENKLLSETVERHVNSQKLFSNDKNRQYLLQASHSRLLQFKADLESKNKGAQQSSDHKAATMKLLRVLMDLKLESENHSRVLQMLDQPQPRMSVYDLLFLMFTIIKSSMYPKTWQPLFQDTVRESPESGQEEPLESTVPL